MSKKILALGLGQNNFLSYLYAVLKLKYPDYQVVAPLIKDLNDEKKDESWMYDNQQVRVEPLFIHYLFASGAILFNRYLYLFFHYILLVERKPFKAIHFGFSFFKECAFLIANKNFKMVDVFHFHFMQYSYLRSLFLLPKGAKVICSFWGSDLLRTADSFNHFVVYKALRKASIVTCQTPEMKEIILAKFGRDLEPKIRICLFPLDRITYEHIDHFRNDVDEIKRFKENFGFHSTKKNVLIGHNGNAANQQIKTLQCLATFEQYEEYHFVINLNYGCPPNELVAFKQELIQHLDRLKASYFINEIYYSKKELALSRLATDIFIHVPISDALSGSVLEMLYAETTVITGSWLNYKTFKKAGLQYFEVETLDDIPILLKDLDQNSSKTQNQQENRLLINDHFSNDKIIANWHEAYQAL
ncbi:hypothetical protein SAMN05444377_101378 [Flavobacterium fontis]|uniref:Uncharacterized protein n=1 Tax=Flavobacterium fontis TaxID=1124188 RepID=A0A1M4WQC4_9FLAO|nr:glycosyltransferase [Flavobacterium fontis]SHE83414.1 hypothetical protein SAMN05444377_101378 [Flavobacterium fontis]